MSIGYVPSRSQVAFLTVAISQCVSIGRSVVGSIRISYNLCFAWAFWNGQDPILKERLFGLTGPQGNHNAANGTVLQVGEQLVLMNWRSLYLQLQPLTNRLLTAAYGIHAGKS